MSVRSATPSPVAGGVREPADRWRRFGPLGSTPQGSVLVCGTVDAEGTQSRRIAVGKYYSTARLQGREIYWFSVPGIGFLNVTHWRPLPDFPDSAGASS